MSNKPKLTRWFDLRKTSPTMPGVYEVSAGPPFGQALPFPFHHWNGATLGGPHRNPDAAAMDEGTREAPGDFYLDDAVWRGLKEPA